MQSSTAVVATSGGALASGIATVAVMEVGLPPPSDELARVALARWINGGGMLRQWRLGWDRIWSRWVTIL
jgi:hypothetical protein